MKNCLLTLTLIAGCVASATPAFAQSAPSAQPQGHAIATTAPRAAAGAPKAVAAVTAASADARGPERAAGATRFTAAGSVVVLADGIVANASNAQILPPAPGFAYDH